MTMLLADAPVTRRQVISRGAAAGGLARLFAITTLERWGFSPDQIKEASEVVGELALAAMDATADRDAEVRLMLEPECLRIEVNGIRRGVPSCDVARYELAAPIAAAA